MTFATLRCRCWHCEHCQPRRRARLISEAVRGKPNTFITLTLPATWRADPEGGVTLLAHAWRLFRKRYRRRHPKEHLPFMAVVEKTKAGTPHLHILARSKWVDQKFLSAVMAELAEAPIVHIRRIKPGDKVVAYCAKYVGKEPAKIGTKKRYWRSQDYLIVPEEPREGLPEGWYRLPALDLPLSEAVRRYMAIGYQANWRDDHTCDLLDVAGRSP